jgi:hypothetical protein
MTEGRRAREQVCTATGREQFERPNQPFQVRSSGNNPIKLFSGGAPWRESSGFVMIRGTLRFWWKRPEEIYRGQRGEGMVVTDSNARYPQFGGLHCSRAG